MFKFTSVIYFIFFSFMISKSNKVYGQEQLDSTFINWNKSTFKSLNLQAEKATDSIEKAIYKNRLLSIKAYWNINNLDDSNNKSIRYNFLKILFKKKNRTPNNFYIIEANEYGSKVILRNFVILIDSTNIITVEFYDFLNGKWQKTGRFKKVNFQFSDDLKIYISQFGKGFNYDDMVITEFKNCRVKKSEFYLYSTLSMESEIKKILDGYKKENYLK